MNFPACAQVELPGRIVVLAVNADQLAHREPGDLITAEIISVHPPNEDTSNE